MNFTEAVLDYLHDILYSDNVPVGYKQQAHQLLDQYRDETGTGLAYSTNSQTKWQIVTNTSLGTFNISNQTYDEINAHMPTQKINAIKALRQEGVKRNAAGEVIQQIFGLKEAKDVIDNWSGWEKRKVRA